MNKAIFLDRDGTINIEKNYLYKREDFEYLPGVIEGLRILQDLDFILIIITNQSGISRGYYTEKDFQELNKWMLKDLDDKGVHIAEVYYCPHHPEAVVDKYHLDCDCRKPKLGLYDKAIKKFDIDIVKSYAIGDKIRDLMISTKGCQCYLVEDNENAELTQMIKDGKCRNITYQNDLLSCALEIKNIEERNK